MFDPPGNVLLINRETGETMEADPYRLREMKIPEGWKLASEMTDADRRAKAPVELALDIYTKEHDSYRGSYNGSADRLKGARAVLLELFPRWIPIDERMPEEDVDVAVLHGGTWRSIATYGRLLGILVWTSQLVEDFGPVTHWMPLPEAPR